MNLDFFVHADLTAEFGSILDYLSPISTVALNNTLLLLFLWLNEVIHVRYLV